MRMAWAGVCRKGDEQESHMRRRKRKTQLKPGACPTLGITNERDLNCVIRVGGVDVARVLHRL